MTGSGEFTARDGFTPPGQLGPFSLRRALGRGGTGSVYLYQRVSDFEQQVAVKFLHAATLDGQLHAITIPSLSYTSIARTLDITQTPDGTPALIMEFVDGPDVEQYAATAQLDLAARLRLLLQVVDAVAFAHSCLVTHDDLKPANILVSPSGVPKLIDFPLGYRNAAIAAAANLWSTPSVRRPVRFTAGYASPERCLGAPGSIASDIFALGRTAGVLLSPAAGADCPHLRAVFAKACHPDPQQRYARAADLGVDLRAVLEHRPVRAYRSGRLETTRRWAGRNPAVAGLLLVCALLIVTGTLGVLVETARAVHGRRIAQARLQALVATTGTLERDLYQTLPNDAAADGARQVLLEHVDQTLRQLQVEAVDDPALTAELAAQQQTSTRLRATERHAVPVAH